MEEGDRQRLLDEDDKRRLKQELGLNVVSEKDIPGKVKYRARYTGRAALDVLVADRALVGLRKIRKSEEDVIISNYAPTRKKWEYATFALHINEDGCMGVAPHMMEQDINIVGMADIFDPTPAPVPAPPPDYIDKLVPVSCHRFGMFTKIVVVCDCIPIAGDSTQMEIYVWDTNPGVAGWGTDALTRILYRKTLAPAAVGDILVSENMKTPYTSKFQEGIVDQYPNILWVAIRMSGGLVRNSNYGFRVRLESESRLGDANPKNISPTPQT